MFVAKGWGGGGGPARGILLCPFLPFRRYGRHIPFRELRATESIKSYPCRKIRPITQGVTEEAKKAKIGNERVCPISVWNSPKMSVIRNTCKQDFLSAPCTQKRMHGTNLQGSPAFGSAKLTGIFFFWQCHTYRDLFRQCQTYRDFFVAMSHLQGSPSTMSNLLGCFSAMSKSQGLRQCHFLAMSHLPGSFWAVSNLQGSF